MNLLMSCIGRRGYIARYFRSKLASSDQVIGTSNTHWTPGFLDCDRSFLLPSYADEDAYRLALLELCQRERIDGLLSFMDEDVVVISRFSDELRSLGVTPMMPPHNVAMMCFDKWLAFTFFRDYGFDTALTYREYETALEAVSQDRLDFPLVVKPRFGFGSLNTFVAHNERELDVFFHYQEDMLIQELLIGEEFDLDILCGLDCEPLAVVPWRKYRSRLGETEQAVTVESRPLLKFGVALATAVGLVGPMDVDLFISGESIRILEMNPRFGGGYPVSHLAGADFPAMILGLLRGEYIEARIGNYERGVAMMKDLVPFGGPSDQLFGDLHIREKKA